MARGTIPRIVLGLALAAGPAYAAPVVLSEAPAYYWYHGCGPTSAASVLAYWDLHALPNLFEAAGADLYLTANVQDRISSPEHNAKYDPTPDNAALPVPPKTSVAGWLGTSVDPWDYGWGALGNVPKAFTGYAPYRGYTFTSSTEAFATFTWAKFTAEIDAGRPMMFYVDASGDGWSDHFVAVYGYDDRGAGGRYYACYTTYTEAETLAWYAFRGVSATYTYGIANAIYAAPPGQYWRGASGPWTDAANWTGSPPGPATGAWIDNGGSAQVEAGAVAVAALCVGDYASGTVLQTGGSVAVSGTLTLASRPGSSGTYDLRGGTLTASALVNNGLLVQTGGTADVGDVSGSGSLSVGGAGAVLAADRLRGQALVIGAGAAVRLSPAAAGGGTSVLASLAIAGGASPAGLLDLADNALVLDYPAGGPTPLADVAAWVRAGYDKPPKGWGRWDGPGVTSGLAAADPGGLTAIGLLDNADPSLGGRTTFAGDPVDATAILVRYTWWGDANLDGVVTLDDYDALDYSYWFPPPPSARGWWSGDFDYDGDFDFDDYDLLDYAYWFQGGPLGGDAARAEHAPYGGAAGISEPGQLAPYGEALPATAAVADRLAAPAGESAALGAAVAPDSGVPRPTPEPASVLLLVAGAALAARRRRGGW